MLKLEGREACNDQSHGRYEILKEMETHNVNI